MSSNFRVIISVILVDRVVLPLILNKSDVGGDKEIFMEPPEKPVLYIPFRWITRTPQRLDSWSWLSSTKFTSPFTRQTSTCSDRSTISLTPRSILYAASLQNERNWSRSSPVIVVFYTMRRSTLRRGQYTDARTPVLPLPVYPGPSPGLDT